MSLYLQGSQGDGNTGKIVANVGEEEGRVVDPECTAISTEVEKSADSGPVVSEGMNHADREFLKIHIG
jgi:hypothetical protein